MGDRLTLETADVEWLPWKAKGDDATLVAYVGLYRVFLGHDGECWSWRMDLLGEQSELVEMFDGANGLIPGSLGKAQARAVVAAQLLSELVEGVDVLAPVPRAYIVAHQQLQRLVSVADPDGRLPNARCADAHASVMETNAAVDAVVAMRDIPRDYTVPREQCARLVHFILTPDSEQRAYCLDPVGTIASVDAAIAEVEHLRGPTEGASDAAVRQIVRELQVWAGGLGEREPNIAEHLLHHARRILSALGERPPTGEASPADDSSSGKWEKRARAYRGCATLLRAERDEALLKLGTLIGAVETHYTGATWTPELNALRSAARAARGDAPTASPVQPNGASEGPSLPDWTEEERTRAAWGDALELDPNGAPYSVALLSSETARLSSSSPAPQVPDSPGWDRARVENALLSWFKPTVDLGSRRGIEDAEQVHLLVGHLLRGGRCTRGAPDEATVPRSLVVKAREELKAAGLRSEAAVIDGVLRAADDA